MHKQLRAILNEFAPPILKRFFINYINTKYGFHGDYATWEEARSASKGYDSDLILMKTKDALLKVKQGEAAYERDSILYEELQYNWPILCGLLMAARINHNRLRVLDFGGSLGSVYFQHRDFLSFLSELRWSVVEQEKYVAFGKQYFEDEYLRFFYDTQTCITNEHIDVVLLSSVLPYLEKPYDVLEEIISFGIRHVIIDRMPLLLTGARDRLTIQKVRPSTYPASYPAWFFNRRFFFDFIQKHYRILAAYDNATWSNVKSEFKGFILEKN